MIYLVGFMGSGKSTVARALAAVLSWEYVDLDEEIERSEGMTVPELFRKEGEAAFRAIEARVLEEISRREEIVVACGGGTPCGESNMEVIRRTGTSVWLDVPLDVMLRRCAGGEGRPLLSDRPAMEALLEARRPAYSQADFRVDASSKEPDQIARLIARRLGGGSRV